MVDDNNTINDDVDFEKSFEQSFRDIQENSIVNATVIEISNDIVFLDFGYKSEAKIPTSEIPVLPKVGDVIDVYLIMLEGRNGQPVVSRKRVDLINDRKNLKMMWKHRECLKGNVIEIKKNGVVVEYKSIRGFIPTSLFDPDRDVRLENFLNKEVSFYIERLDLKDPQFLKKDTSGPKNKKDEEFMGNRRKALEDEKLEKKSNFFNDKTIGETVDGIVKTITDYGAFIDIGGLDALLRIKDIAWQRFNKIEDVLKSGDRIKVKILNIDKETRKVNVGLKQLQDDPWDKFCEKYNVNDTVTGTVVSMTTYGAFVKIIDGVEGLLHISDMSWIKKISSPQELFKMGQNLELKIIKIDKENRKVGLSLKHLLDNPWDKIGEKYKVGTIIKGKISNVTAFGFFIELEQGIEALLHIDDVSWTEVLKNPHEYYKVGDEVDAVVTECDINKNKIKVSKKHLTEDPWQVLKDNYKKGDAISCSIENIDEEKGLLVKITDQVSTFIPLIHIDAGRVEEIRARLKSTYKIGDKIDVVITSIDYKKRKINVSIKEYTRKKEKESVASFLHNENEDSTYTLGDSLKAKEEEKEEDSE